MSARRQFARAGIAVVRFARRVQPIFLVGALYLCAAHSYAQTQPPGAVGRVEGKDISVEDGPSVSNSLGQALTGIIVSNGSVVTVHSGHARMVLFAGGQVEVCGPAKFTLLQTNGAITVALNFGRVRVQLPLNSALRVFTPTIVATPLDISGGARDVAVGLNLDDSLCVRATSGAIQLEHQFSGEKLIVPEAGEFFLNAGQLLPVAGTPGSCECDVSDSIPIVVPAPSAPPEYAIVTRSSPADPGAPPQPGVESAAGAAPPASFVPLPPVVLQKPGPDFDLQVLARASEAHPVPPPKNVVFQQPPDLATTVGVGSALTYVAPNLRPPLDPGPDMILLIRQAQVAPDWEFTGHVAAPEFAVAMQRALGQGAPAAAAHPQEPKPAKAEKKKGGFWASLKKAFGAGSGDQQD
jgi:hypothetical protein